MKTSVYNQKGAEAGEIELPSGVFDLPWNADLVHQVVNSMEASSRAATAHTKNRGDVRGGGKKPWQQKGTGRARHGSIRSPLWRGGGTTFGPRADKNYDRKVNRKMKTKALNTVLSKKLKEGEIVFLDALLLSKLKSKLGKEVLTSLSNIKGFEAIKNKKQNALFIALDKKNEVAEKSFRNFRNIKISELRNLNPVDAMKFRYLAIINPKESLQVLSRKTS